MALSKAQKKEVARLLGNGLSIAKVAEAVSCGVTTVKRIKQQLKAAPKDKPNPLTKSYEAGIEEYAAELKEKGDKARSLIWKEMTDAFEDVEKYRNSVDWDKTAPRDLIAARESAVKLAAQYVQFSDAIHGVDDEPSQAQ